MDRKDSPLSSKLPFECAINFQETVKEDPEKISMRRQKGVRKVKFEKKPKIIKEGDLLKHSKTALKKGSYRHFKLFKDALHYSRLKVDTEDNLIDIIGASIAERGTKNTSHTFSVITESRTLILSAETRREMEDWMRKMRSCAEKRIDKTDLESTQTLSGLHNWCSTTHNKPVFCNKCRDVLSGANFVACEVCNIKSHQSCANGITQACKWTTIESMVRDGIKFTDKSLNQPHQWLEGNLPSNSKCIACSKQCGSKKALQDWSCIWCRQCCHEACRAKVKEQCTLGKNDKLILPAKATCEDWSDLNWKITDTSFNFHPFLAFVNSRSGDNQGVKFVRRLRSLLNPLQVIDLGVTTPEPALEVYKSCKSFQILACGGDGTVGWILQCLDKFNLHKKATTIVVPLGTGNDLSRVLGWGAACNDDAKLEGILEDIPKCIVRKLDRWSVSQYPLSIPTLQVPGRRTSVSYSPLTPKEVTIPEEDTIAPTLNRRRSSTGMADLQQLQRDMFNTMESSIASISLPDFKNIDIPISTKLVTFNFNDLTTDDGIQISSNFDDGEFTGTVPTTFFNSTSVNMDREQNVNTDEILANQLKQLCTDIQNNFPKPGNLDLTITAKLCTKLKVWTKDFLSTMEKHMKTEEMDVDITASKSQALLLEMPILLNFISKVKRKASKFSIPEKELLDRGSCFLLVAQNAKFVHLESEDRSEYISLLMGLLLKASNASDMTNFKNMIQNKLREFDTEVLSRSKSFSRNKRKSIFQEIKNLPTMNNYIGIGLDAKIALDFHNLREEHPEACKTRGQNKMWYGVFTGRQMVSKEFKNLSQRLTLECDGEEIALPQLQGIVLLNIPSYMAGTNFWGTDKEAGSFSAPAIDDKKLEVIAVMGTSHMAESKMFGVQRHRLAQAETVKLTIRGSRQLPIQVDGEAWLQDPGVIIVRHKNKARMLVHNSKKFVTNLSQPQLISRKFGSLDNPESLCDVEIYELVEAVEKLLEAIKIIIQSKKAEFQESVDKDFILIYQKMSFTFLQAYGPDGQLIVQGMHHVRDELISSAKSLVKETLLYIHLSDIEAEMKGMITKALDVVVGKLKILMK